jgi:hypothetical protein
MNRLSAEERNGILTERHCRLILSLIKVAWEHGAIRSPQEAVHVQELDGLCRSLLQESIATDAPSPSE